MQAEHFGGRDILSNRDDVSRILSLRFAGHFNEIWLSRDAAYPCMSILIRDRVACVHYFPSAGHPGFAAQRGAEAATSAGSLEFRTNTPHEPIEVDGGLVVSMERATEAALLFMQDGRLPSNLSWLEL